MNARLGPAQLSTERKIELIRVAYLRTLSRYPDRREEERALDHVNSGKNVIAPLRDVLWALINTQEFIVNH